MNKWAKYEKKKQKIRDKKLSHRKYEAEVKKVVKKDKL